MAPRVLITGVTGYIAAWIAFGAQSLGYRVRGTVRSLRNKDKTQFLSDMNPTADFPVELVEADLTSDRGWQEAVEGVDYIIHVASPFAVAEPVDPNELISPAVEGTLRVLRFASQAAVRPKRVVITSSSFAITLGQKKDRFNDDDWSDVNSTKHPLSTYAKSKTLAERAAWDFIGQLPPNRKLDIAVINPGFVLGPMLSGGNDCMSADLMRQIIVGELGGIPDLPFHYVDVHDVARAHLLAMTHPNAGGKRFALSAGEINYQQIAQILHDEFKSRGYKSITTLHAPKVVMRMLAFFGDRQVRGILSQIGRRSSLSCNNTKNILKFENQEPWPELFSSTVRSVDDSTCQVE